MESVPPEFIHTPWEMPAEVQRESSCVVGDDYPERIVDHNWARERTMAAFRGVKE
jgi:deoxyribodipyrimidine photo-lyase